MLTLKRLNDKQQAVLDDVIERLKVFQTPEFFFDEIPHKYYLGETELTSVTTYLHHFARPFDTEYWSVVKAKERNMSVHSLLAEWKQGSDRACYLGSEVHKWIEDFYNGNERTLEGLDPEVIERIVQFKKLYQARLWKLTPLAQELRMFNQKMKLAGTLDALFMDEEGVIYILDYKTNKSLTTDADRAYGNMLYEFANQKDNLMNHYSVQTSIYRLMLREVGIDAKDCFIVYIPPTGECRVMRCKDFRPQLIEHFNLEAQDYGLTG